MGNCFAIGFRGNRSSRLDLVDNEYVPSENYNGETKSGKRHGRGVYHYPNGDIYDGEWRKSKKYGRGVFTSSDGKTRQEGYFYNDDYIGQTPNKKISKRMKKTEKKKSLTEETAIRDNRTLKDHQDYGVRPTVRDRNRRTYNIAGGGESSKKNEDFLDGAMKGSSSYEYFKRWKGSKSDETKERRESKKLRENIRKKYHLDARRKDFVL